MIVFYVLVSVLPFIRHPLWSLFVGSLTLVKITGLFCIAYALLYMNERRSTPAYLRTWQARWAVTLCLIGMASYIFMGAPLPLELSPFLSYASFLAFLFVTVTLVDSLYRLRWTLLTAVGSMGYASLHVIREWQKSGFDTGYRPGWVTGDPNYFSLSALLCLPFAFYLLRPRQPRWERSFCLACLSLTMIALTLASSRGGLLGLSAAVLFGIWRSRHRAGLLVAAAFVLVPLMVISPSSPLTRLFSPNYSDQESTDTRLMLWRAGLKMVQSNPLTGIGVGNFKPLVPQFLEPGEHGQFIAHNTYLEIAAELGVPALMVFLALLVTAFRSAGKIRRLTMRSGPVLVTRTAEGIQAGLIAYAIAIFFVSAEYQKLFWFVVFLSACLPGLTRSRRSSRTWWASGGAVVGTSEVTTGIPSPAPGNRPFVGDEPSRGQLPNPRA